MAENLLYVVTCSCTGTVQPVAFIDDHRPTDHPQSSLRGFIKVTGPTHQFLASGLASTLAVPKGAADLKRMDRNVTEIAWGDGHVEWTLRCLNQGCKEKQAQMHRDTLVKIADLLAESADQWHLIPSPGPGAGQQRHMVPLRVLNVMIQQLNR